jgi:diguanylate cyclase (GGDEF)-like protein
MQSLQECLNRAAREHDYRFAALFLDLDNFKLVNDSFGHECGDALLLEMANRLRTSLRSLDTLVRLENDTAARIGGDEFVIVLESVRRETDAIAIAERLLEQLAEPLVVRSQVFNLGVSIGIAFGDKTYPSADDLLRDADTAMYRAKAAGKSRYAVFDTAMHVATRERLELENDLRRAIDDRKFQLAYQPIVELATGRIVSFEALVRWDDGKRTTGPDQFIPVSEETGLIVPLGQIILEDACHQAAQWNPPGAARNVSLNINVSRRQLLETDFPGAMRDVVKAVGVSPSLLNLEITETAVIDNVEAATERLTQLKQIGLGLQLDDFGTGYSSLSCLHRFPLDIVKIDRSFTATLSQNQDYAAIIRAIVSLAHTLKMRVTVEGVETADQLRQIRELGCDYAQGYFLARPLTSKAATELLARSGGVLSICL